MYQTSVPHLPLLSKFANFIVVLYAEIVVFHFLNQYVLFARRVTKHRNIANPCDVQMCAYTIPLFQAAGMITMAGDGVSYDARCIILNESQPRECTSTHS